MDDGGIVGSPELLLKVWEILKKGGVPLGLELNSKKCEWSWLNPDCNLVCPIDGVPILRSLLKLMPKLLSPPPLVDWGFGVSSIMPTERYCKFQVTTSEKWTTLPDKDCSRVYHSQRTASATTDTAI